MAVHRRDVPALVTGQRLVPFEWVGDVADQVPQGLAVHQGIDTAQGVDAGDLRPHDAAEPGGDAQVRLQVIETATAGGEEREGTGEGRGDGDLGTEPGIGQGGESFAQPEDLLDRGAEPSHHGEGFSASEGPLRLARDGFCGTRAWRLCWETSSSSRLTRRPAWTPWRTVSWRALGM